MPTEAKAGKEEPQGQPEQSPKGLPVKTMIAVAVMLIVEGVVIVGAVKMFGMPSAVQGVGLEASGPDEGDMLEEIPVLHEKFTNSASGRVWIWDTEVIIKVKKRHAGEPEGEPGGDKGHGGKSEKHADHAGLTVRQELKARAAEIRTGIGAIISSAQHSYFTEPGRETLSRQVLQYLRGVFGHDAEGNERVVEALIPRCLGFPADY